MPRARAALGLLSLALACSIAIEAPAQPSKPLHGGKTPAASGATAGPSQGDCLDGFEAGTGRACKSPRGDKGSRGVGAVAPTQPPPPAPEPALTQKPDEMAPPNTDQTQPPGAFAQPVQPPPPPLATEPVPNTPAAANPQSTTNPTPSPVVVTPPLPIDPDRIRKNPDAAEPSASASASPSARTTSRPDWTLLLAALAVAAAGAGVAVFAFMRQRALANRIHETELLLAREFAAPGARLETAEQHIRDFKKSVGEAILGHEKTIESLRADTKRTGASSAAVALAFACGEATEALRLLVDDADFRELVATLPVENCYGDLERTLGLGGQSGKAGVDAWSALQRGELDLPLTLPLLLDAYFPNEGAWYRAARTTGAVDALLRAALARESVEIFVVRPLTRVRSRPGEANVFDIRNIRNLGRARQAVRKSAPMLAQGEDLVVDCIAPGYVAPGRGSNPPRLTYYNPSAW